MDNRGESKKWCPRRDRKIHFLPITTCNSIYQKKAIKSMPLSQVLDSPLLSTIFDFYPFLGILEPY